MLSYWEIPDERLTYGVAPNSTSFKLAAMDLDGTLLGPDHTISEANALAVRRLQSAGAQVVLASGRHYDSMRKYAAALPGVQWIVSCQGGEVSDAARTTVLSRRFLLPADAAKIMEAGRTRGFSIVGYTVEGVYTDSETNIEMDFYADLTGLSQPIPSHPSSFWKKKIVYFFFRPSAPAPPPCSSAFSTPFKPIQARSRLFKPIQGPPGGRGFP